MLIRLTILALLSGLLLQGCSSTNATGTFPKGGPLIPATNLALTPNVTLSLEHLLYWGGVAAIAYYVVDPYAPNWEIQEARFPGDKVMLSMKMKRYYVGGAGEARDAFQHHAKELVRQGGYRRYEILEYSEGMDSNAIGSQRTAEGVLVLLKTPATADQPGGFPTITTPSSAENPRS